MIEFPMNAEKSLHNLDAVFGARMVSETTGEYRDGV